MTNQKNIRTKRILLIDDDKDFRETFHKRLTEEGYYVVAQAGAASAMDWAIHRDVGNFDMIISDQRMPGELGAPFLRFLALLEKTDVQTLDPRSELYQELRKRFPDLGESEFRSQLKDLKSHPAIRVILSGYSEDGSIQKGLEEGTIGKFLTKKTPIPEILASLHDLLS